MPGLATTSPYKARDEWLDDDGFLVPEVAHYVSDQVFARGTFDPAHAPERRLPTPTSSQPPALPGPPAAPFMVRAEEGHIWTAAVPNDKTRMVLLHEPLNAQNNDWDARALTSRNSRRLKSTSDLYQGHCAVVCFRRPLATATRALVQSEIRAREKYITEVLSADGVDRPRIQVIFCTLHSSWDPSQSQPYSVVRLFQRVKVSSADLRTFVGPADDTSLAFLQNIRMRAGMLEQSLMHTRVTAAELHALMTFGSSLHTSSGMHVKDSSRPPTLERVRPAPYTGSVQPKALGSPSCLALPGGNVIFATHDESRVIVRNAASLSLKNKSHAASVGAPTSSHLIRTDTPHKLCDSPVPQNTGSQPTNARKTYQRNKNTNADQHARRDNDDQGMSTTKSTKPEVKLSLDVLTAKMETLWTGKTWLECMRDAGLVLEPVSQPVDSTDANPGGRNHKVVEVQSLSSLSHQQFSDDRTSRATRNVQSPGLGLDRVGAEDQARSGPTEPYHGRVASSSAVYNRASYRTSPNLAHRGDGGQQRPKERQLKHSENTSKHHLDRAIVDDDGGTKGR